MAYSWNDLMVDRTIQALPALVGNVADGDLFEIADVSATNAAAKATRSQIVAGLVAANNPVFTGTITMPDGSLAIADTSGLQAALDAKAPINNPVFTGTVGIPDGALAIADTSGLQTALNAKPAISGTPAATNYARWTGAATLEARTPAQVRADLDLEVGIDFPAVSHTHTVSQITDIATLKSSPFSNANGPQGSAASGQSWKLTGNVTGVPISNGWVAKYVNTSGSVKTITPASGNCIKTKDGTTAGSVNLANNKSCVVHADEAGNLIVDGDVT